MRRRARLAAVVSAPVALTLLAAASNASAACPGTFATYGGRTTVTVTNNAVTPLANAFAVVTLDHAALVTANAAKADGGDLRFADDQCNALDFWVDGDVNTATTKVWVKVPALAAGANKIFAYYGSAGATRVNDAALLFGSNIVALYPMTEGAGTVVHDRVGGYDLDLTGAAAWDVGPRQGTSSITGFTGGGRAFRTATLPVVGADFATFVAAYPKNVGGSTQGIIGNYSTDGISGWTMKLQGGAGRYMFLTNATGNWCQDPSFPNATANAWQSLAVKREGGLKTAYRNGAANGTACAGDTRDVSTGAQGPWEIGHAYQNNYAFDGSIAFSVLYGAAKTDAEMAALHAGLAFGSDLALVTGTPVRRAGAPTITKSEGGDEKATFTFTPPANDGGAPITGYVVSCNNGDKKVTGAASPLTLEGLTNGTTYTCVVRAVNELGEGTDSATVQVGPADVPGAPTNLVATVNGDSASLAFANPTDTGGSPITGYVARCQAGSLTKDGAASPIVLTALAPASYTCAVAAKNAKGVGPESATATFVIAPKAVDGGGASSSSSSSSGAIPGGDGGVTAPGIDPGASSSDDGGCGCRVVANDDRHPTALLALFGAIGAVLLRRRPRRR